MIEFGKTLRAAREAKGLTIKQIADTTHLMSSIVEDLENERFTKIVAPIYGRGFVKLYCEAVGLDSKPLVAEFMEIFNGNREATIKEKAPTKPPAPAPEPEPVIVERPKTVAQDPQPQPDLFAPPPPPPEPQTEPFAEQKAAAEFELPPLSGNPLRNAPREPEQIQPQASMFQNNNPLADGGGSRYGTPYHENRSRSSGFGISITPAVWRIAIVAVALIALGWGAIAGIGALHKMLTTAPNPSAPTEKPIEQNAKPDAPKESTENSKPKESPTSKKAVAERKSLKVPSLYID